MKQQSLVSQAFGASATSYLTSNVHASGEDLRHLAEKIGSLPSGCVLDLGCGAGHASFAVSPVADEVTAYDMTPEMLLTVADEAARRGLGNITTRQGTAEQLPFQSATFDWAISRFSAHHWQGIGQALREVRRVLKPGGQVIFIDITGNESPILDTHLQAVELLRDGSHVRNYSGREWSQLFTETGFQSEITSRWRIPIDFQSWIKRINTPEHRAQAIRILWSEAPEEVRTYFAVGDDYSFELDALMIHAQ
jgi:ubiquinone/menaquinone biosynthesis C-methylase UbiE